MIHYTYPQLPTSWHTPLDLKLLTLAHQGTLQDSETLPPSCTKPSGTFPDASSTRDSGCSSTGTQGLGPHLPAACLAGQPRMCF